MASITIRNLDDTLKAKLRLHAARLGCSMEEAARQILRAALSEERRSPSNLAEAIHRRFAKLGGLELDIPPRETLRAPRWRPR